MRTVPLPPDAPEADAGSRPLTSKPVLFVANIGEGEPLEPPAELAGEAEARGAGRRR